MLTALTWKLIRKDEEALIDYVARMRITCQPT